MTRHRDADRLRNVKAVGFDLFNTLITVDRIALDVALERLLESLRSSGIDVCEEEFSRAHRHAATRLLQEARKTGRETHNRFWISEALGTLGHDLAPDAPQISDAVESYFSSFNQYSRLIPGTLEMLGRLNGRFGIGLLSNFTHPPAARRILEKTGLEPFFRPILISGELGYRKPHRIVFERLVEGLGVERDEIIYIGDDPEPDVGGAVESGIEPVLSTYVKDHGLSFAPGLMSRSEDETDCLTISQWEELFDLLGL